MAKKEQTAPDNPAPEQDDADDSPLTFSKADLQKLIDDNRKEAAESAAKDAIAKREEEEKKARLKRRAKDAEESEEDLVDAATKAEARAAEAEQRAAAAERKALLKDVEVKLRDYLALNHKEYLGNALDIMLHVEKAVPIDATDALITRIIDAQAKAFVERSKAARGTGGGAPGSAVRGRMAGTGQQQTNQTSQQQGERQTAAAPRFRTLNWHG